MAAMIWMKENEIKKPNLRKTPEESNQRPKKIIKRVNQVIRIRLVLLINVVRRVPSASMSNLRVLSAEYLVHESPLLSSLR